MKLSRISLYILSGSIFFTTVETRAQEKLSLEQAVQIALQNNFDIKLSANTVEQSKNNVSRGASALYPVVSGNFSSNTTIQNSKQTLSNGQTQERDNAKNSNLSYGPVSNWKVFDGFEMFARYKQLQELQKLEESNLQSTIQTTLAGVISNYYDLVQQQQQIRALSNALEISKLRLKNSQSRYQIGKAARLEVLAASVDLNADTSNLLRQRDIYRNTRIRMNELLARDISTEFIVADSILIKSDLKLADLQTSAIQQNPALKAALLNQRIAELNLKQVSANRYPDISVNTGYNFSKSTSALGFAQKSSGRGLNYGVTASINIFSGFLQKRNEKGARLEIDNSRLEYSRSLQSVQAQLASLFQSYQTNLELVKLEQHNVEVAKQNLDITLEKFKLGSVAPLEFREAQRNYIEASARYTNAQYQAKLAEITLKQVAGTLTFD